MKSRLLDQFLVSLLITAVLFIVIYIIIDEKSNPKYLVLNKTLDMNMVWEYYSTHIRGNLFAGLLAVGGFLMTGKTFILVTMKQSVFDDEKYILTFNKHVKFDNTLKRYAPLIQLKDILYVSVYMTIIASIIQLTIGLIPYWVASIIAVFFAIWSLVLVIDSLNLIKKNLDYWLNDN
ncbi:hypothetical protein C9J21_11640 [Photobacterium phosphoreum]|uniref:hypothetical protein n=1 Tax=Photobacterium phosphoreum TaxID=659 RepID=UPI000D153823|nr:hypothetical protein [Photobacterium phosphoreum]PSW32486.1 hypothetical protein C9J21_11640 [Photobacterium phosphoreum]